MEDTDKKALTIPPPPPILPNLVKKEDNSLKVISIPKPELNEAIWAADHPDLQKACFFGRVCLHDSPKEYKYDVGITSILQKGPTCGLTAISMLLKGNVTAEELLKTAQKRCFSHCGEMFSALNCQKLLTEELQRQDLTGFDTTIWDHPLNCDEIKDELRRGSFLLVPYDADVNHAPTLLKGHRAHWALIIGYLIDKEENFYVLARHGKSSNLAAWSLESLSESNMNLNEFAQPKEHPDDVFLLPEEGIAGPLGLKGKSILIKIK